MFIYIVQCALARILFYQYIIILLYVIYIYIDAIKLEMIKPDDPRMNFLNLET